MKRIILPVLCLIVLADPSRAGVQILGGLTHEMTLQPGGQYEGKIQLVNNNEDTVRVEIFQTDYLFTADGNTSYGDPGHAARSNAGWISVRPKRVIIPPKATTTIYYETQIPPDAGQTGTYWSVIMVEPVEDANMPRGLGNDEKTVMGVKTVIRYAIQIVTNIGESGESSIRFLENKLIHSDGRLLFQADIENTGSDWLRPSLWAELYHKDGTYLGRFESEQQRIFPSCSVRHHLDLTDVPKGEYTGVLVVDNGDEHVFGTNFDIRLE